MIRRFKPEQALTFAMFCCALMLVGCFWIEAFAADPTNKPPLALASPNPVASVTTARADELAQNLIGKDFIVKHRSVLSFGLDQVPFLQVPFLGTPRWQYFASFIYIFLAFYLSKYLDWIIKNQLTRWVAKTENRWDDTLLALANGPTKFVTFILLFHLGLQIFDWPSWLETSLSKLTLIILALACVTVLLRVIDFLIRFWSEQQKSGSENTFNDQFLILIGKLLKAILIIVAVLTLLSNLSVNITALLGSVSVLGLALGLAAQDTVSNLFGTVAVFVDKPFKVGDRIKVGSDVDGIVEQMGLRSTKVRSVDGFLITVPNKAVGNNTVINITARPSIRSVLNYGLTYDTPTDRLRRASFLLHSIFSAHPLCTECFVTFNRFDASSLNFEVIVFLATPDFKEFSQAIASLNFEVKERFDAETLEFAFPTQTVHMRPQSAFLPSSEKA